MAALNANGEACHQDGIVIISWFIIMAPVSIVNYVVVHELYHLLIHDHSHDYWALIAKVMPNFQQLKDDLRINGSYFEI